jgi:heme-degrading monooxygenase HmoA
MIVRIWHGKVPASKAKAYRDFVNTRAIPDYQSVEGNLSVHILERREGDITHFITLTFWKDLDSIKRFAGEDMEIAKYYPEDQDFLLEFEPKVVHYEVVGQSYHPSHE